MVSNSIVDSGNMNLDPTPSSPLRGVYGDCRPGVKRKGPFSILVSKVPDDKHRAMSTVVDETNRNGFQHGRVD